jgi:hypothetical protein
MMVEALDEPSGGRQPIAAWLCHVTAGLLDRSAAAGGSPIGG